MRYLILFVISLGIISCATTQKYTYDITRPVAGVNDLLGACWNDTLQSFVFIHDEEVCPPGTILWGAVISLDFTRNLLHYVEELEIRGGIK